MSHSVLKQDCTNLRDSRWGRFTAAGQGMEEGAKTPAQSLQQLNLQGEGHSCRQRLAMRVAQNECQQVLEQYLHPHKQRPISSDLAPSNAVCKWF